MQGHPILRGPLNSINFTNPFCGPLQLFWSLQHRDTCIRLAAICLSLRLHISDFITIDTSR